jgi:hypothetical protein
MLSPTTSGCNEPDQQRAQINSDTETKPISAKAEAFRAKYLDSGGTEVAEGGRLVTRATSYSRELSLAAERRRTLQPVSTERG